MINSNLGPLRSEVRVGQTTDAYSSICDRGNLQRVKKKRTLGCVDDLELIDGSPAAHRDRHIRCNGDCSDPGWILRFEETSFLGCRESWLFSFALQPKDRDVVRDCGCTPGQNKTGDTVELTSYSLAADYFSDMKLTAPDTVFNVIAHGGSAQDLSELLTQTNFDINESNTAGLTCLTAAIINGDGTHVLAVLDAGANISDGIIDFAKRYYPHKIDIEVILRSVLASRTARASLLE